MRSAVADRTRAARVRDALRYTLADSALSLLLSFIVNMAVVAAFAAFFWSAACGDETACVPDAAGDGTPGAACASNLLSGTCSTIGLGAAAPALGAVLGRSGAVIFGVGLLAAGQASTTAATIAGQYVMEGFFDWDVARWKRVALSRFLALGPAVFVAVSPMGQRNSFNEMLNVLQSACLPFAMLPLLHLARDERLMGRFANGPRLNRVVTTASVVVLAVNLILVYQYALADAFDSDRPPAYAVGVSLATLAYLYAVSLAFRPRPAPEAPAKDDDAVAAFLRQEIELRAKGRVPKHGLATPVDPTAQVCCCGKNPDATRDLV